MDFKEICGGLIFLALAFGITTGTFIGLAYAIQDILRINKRKP